jgi:single-strand DNA-binding protein
MVNRVVLVGRLTRDPEMKYTPAGVAVATLGIAVNRVTKNDQGDYETDFFNVVAWRRTAEFASNYLTKGRLVAVDGKLQTRSWVTQDGQKRSVVEIVADSLEGLDRRGDAAQGAGVGEAAPSYGGGDRAPAAAPAGGRPAAPAAAAPVDDDEDPFADE